MARYTYEVVLSSNGASADASGPDGAGAFTHRGTTNGGFSAVSWDLAEPQVDTFTATVGSPSRILWDEPSGVTTGIATVTRRVSGFSDELAGVVATFTFPSAGAGDSVNGVFDNQRLVIIDTNRKTYEVDIHTDNTYAAAVTSSSVVHQGPREGRLRLLGNI